MHLLFTFLVQTDGPTSFHGLLTQTETNTGKTGLSSTDVSYPPSVPPSSSVAPPTPGEPSDDKHRLKKKKKKNKHKHKHKHKHDRHEKERSKDRERMGGDRMGVASPMVPSVQSVTSLSSNTRDSAPSSPEFEVI